MFAGIVKVTSPIPLLRSRLRSCIEVGKRNRGGLLLCSQACKGFLGLLKGSSQGSLLGTLLGLPSYLAKPRVPGEHYPPTYVKDYLVMRYASQISC